MARPPVHPGEILADELEELGMSAAELALALGVPANLVIQLLRSECSLSADTALRLGRWFGTGPEIWLNLQKSYELRLAEQTSGDEIRRTVVPRDAA